MRIPDLTDTIKLMSVGFGVTAFAHFGSDLIAPWIAVNAPGLEKFSLTSGFFWLIVIIHHYCVGFILYAGQGIGGDRRLSVWERISLCVGCNHWDENGPDGYI